MTLGTKRGRETRAESDALYEYGEKGEGAKDDAIVKLRHLWNARSPEILQRWGMRSAEQE